MKRIKRHMLTFCVCVHTVIGISFIIRRDKIYSY